MQDLFDEYLKKKGTKKSENSQQIDASCLKWTPHVKRWNAAPNSVTVLLNWLFF